mmetsp:Transcript_1341/g.4645  ORF Transcript_1341/g.4645 Transcript_1341/m.4645 type:complete len:475 (+) Transcript_1341:42-1466(+)
MACTARGTSGCVFAPSWAQNAVARRRARPRNNITAVAARRNRLGRLALGTHAISPHADAGAPHEGVGDEEELAASVQLFEELQRESGTTGAVRMGRDSYGGFGLFVTRDVQPNEVILSVPRGAACLEVGAKAFSLPPGGTWTRVRAGLEQPYELPWDVHMARALVDCKHGDGGVFWQEYSRLLPTKSALCQPLCLTEVLLHELHHAACEEGGRQQQARLAALCPDMMQTPTPQNLKEACGSCSDLQWAFACVRSRAFTTGEHGRSMVPFADMANHTDAAQGPNSDFRCEGISWEGSGRPAQQDLDKFELVALRALGAGEEVLISYSGQQVCQNNRRLMAQYGYFVPANKEDRLDFTSQPGFGLREDTLKRALGASTWNRLSSGSLPRLLAVVRSLPIETDASERVEAAVVADLMEQCEMVAQSWPTSLEEDLQQLADIDSMSDQRAVLLRFRIDHKQLWQEGVQLLEKYQACLS